MLEPALVGVEFVARNESGPDAARHGPKFAFADQSAHVLLGAAKLDGKVSNCQALRLLHAGSIAPRVHGPLLAGITQGKLAIDVR